MNSVSSISDARRRRGLFAPLDFDALECFACSEVTPCRSVAPGPEAGYRCDACGATWRISPDGDRVKSRRGRR